MMKQLLFSLLRTAGLTLTVTASSLLAQPTTDGLVAWYKLDGNLNDATANANTLTATSPLYTAGHVGGAASGFFRSTHTAIQRPDTAFTATIWVFATGANQYSTAMGIRNDANGAFNTWALGVNVTQITPPFAANWQGIVSTSGTPNVVLAGGDFIPHQHKWTHLALTYSKAASQARLYINGTEVARAFCSGDVVYNATGTTGILTLGGLIPNTPSTNWAGNLDDACLYNRALSETEIAKFYDIQPDLPSAGLVAHYPIQMSNISDFSGNGNHLIPSGGTFSTEPGVVDYSYSTLSPSSAYLSVSAAAVHRPDTAFTAAAWAYATSFNEYATVLSMRNASSDPYNSYYLGVESGFDNRWTAALSTETDGQRTLYGPEPTLGTWNHVMLTYSNARGSAILYINGLPVDTATILGNVKYTVDQDFGRLFVGSVMGVATTNWYGYLDDIRLYNRALTQSEINSGLGTSVAIDRSIPATLALGLYPNPTKDVLYLSLSGAEPIQHLDLIDARGNQLVPVWATDNALDLSGLPAGIYLVRVTTATGSAVKRVVRQ